MVPHFTLHKRTFYTSKLEKSFYQNRGILIEALEKADEVCVTIDFWSKNNKAYLGETVHWYGPDLERYSACIAVKRVKGSHTYDVIAKEIEQINAQFRITKKAVVATTDNGSNFVKAFVELGVGSKAPRDSDFSDSDSESEADPLIYIPVGDIFYYGRSNDDDLEISLPYHIRCACHTLNLVSRVDVKKITDKKFQTIRKSVEKKLRKLCKKQNHSTKNSDMIQEKLGSLFIKENDTRWNSLYNALFRLQHFMSIKGAEHEELMEI